MRFGRGDVDREETAREMALLHARQVEMALAFAGQPDRLARLGGVEHPQQDVVVAIEDGKRGGHEVAPVSCRPSVTARSGRKDRPNQARGGRVFGSVAPWAAGDAFDQCRDPGHADAVRPERKLEGGDIAETAGRQRPHTTL